MYFERATIIHNFRYLNDSLSDINFVVGSYVNYMDLYYRKCIEIEKGKYGTKIAYCMCHVH